jgi:hypothetical protein
MGVGRRRGVLLGAPAVALASAAAVVLAEEPPGTRPVVLADEPPSAPPMTVTEEAFDEPLTTTPPPFTEGAFPCSQCHPGPGDPRPRRLEYHQEVQERLVHPRRQHFCLDCHDLAQRDVLHLLSGETVPFEQSYRVCGQCHYARYRDWRRGIHGKRVGQWDGVKTYFLCVQCHDPHAPRLKPFRPERRPPRPEEIQ